MEEFFAFETDENQDPCRKFCEFLMMNRHKNFTDIARNMKGFDGQFIVGWMLRQGVPLKLFQTVQS